MVDAVSVISRNAHDVEIVSEYHTNAGSSPAPATHRFCMDLGFRFYGDLF